MLHAVNDSYLDRNYGGVLIIWDRLFGSFKEEGEPCIYGTRGALNSWDPLWANAEVYAALARDSWRTKAWADKLRVWFKPPGWRPADLAARYPKPAFSLDAVQTFNPPLTSTQQWFAALQFVVALGAVSLFLWNADALTWSDAAIWVAAITAGMWALGRFLQSHLAALELLMVQAAALACVSSIGMLDYAMVFKPLPMALALVFVAWRARLGGAAGKSDGLLLWALGFSLCGDVLLMLPGDWFVPGLASFLVAHLFYLTLFREGQGWFANRGALATMLLIGASVYAALFSHLGDPTLKLAVAAYVTVISLMAAQALGRAGTLITPSARWVAAGACVFMASDTLIAIDKFLVPVPLASFWILATYFAAQMLIVHHVRADSIRQPG